MNEHDKFILPPLPYAEDALAPYINEETVHMHYYDHFATYVNHLNVALAGYPKYQGLSIEALLLRCAQLPSEISADICYNAGGVYNHDAYFRLMRPAQRIWREPTGQLADAIRRDFGSIGQMVYQLIQLALSVRGSGWAWLVSDRLGRLSLVSAMNQDVPNLRRWRPIIPVDVWEHAYYLQYGADRKAYLNAWKQIINWDEAEHVYREKKGKS